MARTSLAWNWLGLFKGEFSIMADPLPTGGAVLVSVQLDSVGISLKKGVGG